MKFKNNNLHKIILFLLALFLILFFFIFLNRLEFPSEKLYKYSEKKEKTVINETLQVSFNVPEKFEIESHFTGFTLTFNGQSINISRVATNYTNITDYLTDLQKYNKFDLKNREIMNINSYEAVKGFIDKERIYFIYVDNYVFSFFTEAPSLYNDIDQIVRSFKYLPENP
ncbi:hypothetical protein A3A93_06440 [Candidatus Roizmanbacteria bacterium RIFCSPLOWO2_01_FULL_38_12]|uniref:DUF4367 domain-containing protein n=1 Tax=Candidatus Roizmanbacteria bacterium RIFCSPLOWO2_01_FULL_38_12 TaxID=1802061 RepID=A0A1F7IU43_9BACT|nr:MAG: hypothetical protein A3A93_06440 [Candidatus Roizmanbacteria bacterium RIFCSPLOWO2_01_FULL_38_12]